MLKCSDCTTKIFFILPTGSVPVTLSAVASTYHLIMNPMTWSAARNYCRETYDDLAVMESINDWLRIGAEALGHIMISPAWIGLYNVNSWRWSFNNLPLEKMPLSNWYSSEPNDGNACGTISYNGYWFAVSCKTFNSFVCFKCESLF